MAPFLIKKSYEEALSVLGANLMAVTRFVVSKAVTGSLTIHDPSTPLVKAASTGSTSSSLLLAPIEDGLMR